MVSFRFRKCRAHAKMAMTTQAAPAMAPPVTSTLLFSTLREPAVSSMTDEAALEDVATLVVAAVLACGKCAPEDVCTADH
jgi:hypothetical protein